MSQFNESSEAREPLRVAVDGESFEQLLAQPARRFMTIVVLVSALFLATYVVGQPYLGMILLALLFGQLVFANGWFPCLYATAVVLVRVIDDRFANRLDWGSVTLLAVLVIVYLSVSFRLVEMARFAKAYSVDQRESGVTQSLRPWALFRLLVGPRALLIMAGALFAVWLVANFPEQIETERQYGIKRAPGRLIFFLLAMFFLWYIARLIIGTIARFRMSPERADIAMRSMYGTELWHDMAGIERRRAKLNKTPHLE